MTIENPDPAKVYTDALTWTVPSRTDPHVTYHCQLGAYDANGECSCDDFNFNFRGILARGIDGPRAVEIGAVKLRDWQRSPVNALRCWHLMDAADQAERTFARAMTKAAKEAR